MNKKEVAHMLLSNLKYSRNFASIIKYHPKLSIFLMSVAIHQRKPVQRLEIWGLWSKFRKHLEKNDTI